MSDQNHLPYDMNALHDNDLSPLENWLQDILESIQKETPENREDFLLALEWKVDSYYFNLIQLKRILEAMFLQLKKKTDNTQKAVVSIVAIIHFCFNENAEEFKDYDLSTMKCLLKKKNEDSVIQNILEIFAYSKNADYLPTVQKYTSHKKWPIKRASLYAESRIQETTPPERVADYYYGQVTLGVSVQQNQVTTNLPKEENQYLSMLKYFGFGLIMALINLILIALLVAYANIVIKP